MGWLPLECLLTCSLDVPRLTQAASPPLPFMTPSPLFCFAPGRRGGPGKPRPEMHTALATLTSLGAGASGATGDGEGPCDLSMWRLEAPWGTLTPSGLNTIRHGNRRPAKPPHSTYEKTDLRRGKTNPGDTDRLLAEDSRVLLFWPSSLNQTGFSAKWPSH